MSTTVDWSDIPPELLQTIATFLNSVADYIRFRAVCKNWRRSAAVTPRHLPREFPWLMLPLCGSNRRSFFNPLTRNVHRLTLPEASVTCRRAGSSYGWLILIDESSSIFIINPLTRAKITLPPLSSFPNVVKFNIYSIGREYTLRSPENIFYYRDLKGMRDNFVKKVILSCNPPNQDNFFAFSIHGDLGCLAYCKNGYDCWKTIDAVNFYCEDMIYFNGACYAVDKFGSIATCDVNNSDPPALKIINMEQEIRGDMLYLVDAMGDLLLVSRYLEFDIDLDSYFQVCNTIKFCVFKLNMSSWKWEGMTGLDYKVLFLGQNSSFALLASDYSGCKGNRIYFTDDYSLPNVDHVDEHDIGIYDLADGSIESLPYHPPSPHLPIWLTPRLC